MDVLGDCCLYWNGDCCLFWNEKCDCASSCFSQPRWNEYILKHREKCIFRPKQFQSCQIRSEQMINAKYDPNSIIIQKYYLNFLKRPKIYIDRNRSSSTVKNKNDVVLV